MTLIETVRDVFSRINRRVSVYLFNLCVHILQFRDIPQHIAYIADGNRTYSKRRGIARYEAYIKGYSFHAGTDRCHPGYLEHTNFYNFRMEKILHQINLGSVLGITDFTFFIYSRHNDRRSSPDRKDVLAVVELLLKLLSAEG